MAQLRELTLIEYEGKLLDDGIYLSRNGHVRCLIYYQQMLALGNCLFGHNKLSNIGQYSSNSSFTAAASGHGLLFTVNVFLRTSISTGNCIYIYRYQRKGKT